MKKIHNTVIALFMFLLIGCGAENGDESVGTAGQSSPGIISAQQQRALDGANSVEQTLLDAAAQRKKDLEEQLQPR